MNARVALPEQEVEAGSPPGRFEPSAPPGADPVSGNNSVPPSFVIGEIQEEAMDYRFTTLTSFAAIVLPASLAFAQQPATIEVAESQEYGQYLTDSDGRALYLFESDTRGQGDAKATISCSGECLGRWPPFYTEGEPQAGANADAGKLGTVEHDGKMVATYNGWPLYRFVEDAGPGDTKGHDLEEFGAEWYLVAPSGEKAED